MNYTGYTFYNQTGINFSISYPTVDNFYTIKYDFVTAFNKIGFYIQSGQIKNIDQKFIYDSSIENNIFRISGNLSPNEFNLFYKNSYIYTQTGNFGICSGLNIGWDKIDLNNILNLEIKGDKPSSSYIYKTVDYYLNPIDFKISGSENNLGKIIIYSAQFRDANYASKAFEFSGNTYLEIGPGEVTGLTVIQKFPYQSNYVPFVLNTNFGKVFNSLKVIRTTTSPESGNIDIRTSLETGNINNTGNLGNQPYAFWGMKLVLYNAYTSNSGFNFVLSGISGNDNFINGYSDSFNKSWLAVSGNPETKMSIAYDFEETNNITLLDSTNNKQLIYNNVNNGYNINSGYYGFYIQSSGIQQYHKKYWDVTGITINIYKSGVPTGLSGIIPTGISGLSGSILPNNIIFGNNASQWKSGIIRNNPSGSIYLSVYQVYNNISNINNASKIYDESFNLNNLTGAYLSGNYYTINIGTGKLKLNSDSNYILLFSGSASGYFSGTATGITGDGLTGQVPIYYKDYLYLSKNTGEYYLYNTNPSGIYIDNNGEFVINNNNENINLKIDTYQIHDKNQFTGFLPVKRTSYQYYLINILKQIEYNGSRDFLGNAIYILSNNTSCYSGYLNTYRNIYRDIVIDYTKNIKY